MGYDYIQRVGKEVEKQLREEYGEESTPIFRQQPNTGADYDAMKHMFEMQVEENKMLNEEINVLNRDLHEATEYRIAFKVLLRELGHEGN